jgi:hypothetical protein
MTFSCKNPKSDEGEVLIKHLESQLSFAIENVEQVRTPRLVFPRTSKDGVLKLVASNDWTSGFFSGNLWMMYELTGNEQWKDKALPFTLPLEKQKLNNKTHDVGFMMYCSFGQAIKHTSDANFKEILIQTAKTLSSRYNPTVGCIRSWDHGKHKWDFPVIIDNMINLELLLWAAKETGDQKFKEIAIKHAQTTMKHHFRSDYTTYHVVDYNPNTGEVRSKVTNQGYSDSSAWARGQAWGLYGYTMMYRETQMKEFLIQAENIAAYILSQPSMKDKGIPYWDFNAPNIPNEPLDASAAAVIASALYELSSYSENGEDYLKNADRIIKQLSSFNFLSPVNENNGFLLMHSTGSKPHNSEIDVPLVYADYYYLEALIRKRNKVSPMNKKSF